MLPPKNGKPITFKPTKELRETTEAIADKLGESLSDYVRKAVEMRNKQQNDMPFNYQDVYKAAKARENLANVEVKNNTLSKTGKQVQTFFKGK